MDGQRPERKEVTSGTDDINRETDSRHLTLCPSQLEGKQRTPGGDKICTVGEPGPKEKVGSGIEMQSYISCRYSEQTLNQKALYGDSR